MKWSVRVPATGPPWIGETRPELEGMLDIPKSAHGLVLFVHGSGSSRRSPRNRLVAQRLRKAGLATLLFDLLTKKEETADARTGHLRFDIAFLASRLRVVARWASQNDRTAVLRLGYFGADTGAAAALVAAAHEARDVAIAAIVSRGGRTDLAGDALPRVRVPTLLIVGGEDHEVIPLNEQALAQLRCEKRLEIVPGATHLFEEPGALGIVANLAVKWFTEHLPAKEWHR